MRQNEPVGGFLVFGLFCKSERRKRKQRVILMTECQGNAKEARGGSGKRNRATAERKDAKFGARWQSAPAVNRDIIFILCIWRGGGWRCVFSPVARKYLPLTSYTQCFPKMRVIVITLNNSWLCWVGGKRNDERHTSSGVCAANSANRSNACWRTKTESVTRRTYRFVLGKCHFQFVYWYFVYKYFYLASSTYTHNYSRKKSNCEVNAHILYIPIIRHWWDAYSNCICTKMKRKYFKWWYMSLGTCNSFSHPARTHAVHLRNSPCYSEMFCGTWMT